MSFGYIAMSVQLILKNSAVQDKEATAAQLAVGEIALNYYESGPFLQCKDTNGDVWRLGGVVIASTAPSSPSKGAWWFDSDTDQLFFYNGTVWKEIQVGEIAVTDIAEGTARQLLQTNAAGTATEWTSDVDVPGTLDVTGAATFDSNVVIEGDLTVNGTTTTIDTETLLVKDKNIEMAVVASPTDATADGGGITLKGATDKTINWVNATDAWTSSENVDLVSGKTYKINGTDVLSATALGSAVQISSDNIPSGTIVNDDVNASAAIAGTKIDPDFGSQTVETTGVFSAAGGAQATPSITFTGDLNTGIYSPGADQVAISTGGTGRLFVDSDGKVGVGTSSPSSRLHVFNDANTAQATIASSSSGNRAQIDFVNAHSTWSFGVAGGTTGQGLIGTATENVDFGIYTRATGQAQSEKVTIKADGKVGIGTTSPSSTLDVGTGNIEIGGGNNTALTWSSDVSSHYLKFTTALNGLTLNGYGGLAFETNGANERMRIDSSGRLLVGTTSARSTYLGAGISAGINLEAAGNLAASNRSLSLVNGYSSSTDGEPLLYLGRTRSDSIGGTTVVQNNDNLGSLLFLGSDGTNMLAAARIRGEIDGTPGAADMPGRLVFSTTADAASSPTERMTIKSNGNVGIGTTSPRNALDVSGSIFTSGGSQIQITGSPGATGLQLIGQDSAESLIGTMSSQALAFRTASTERVRIDSSGNVGIGTSSPATLLHLASSNPGIRLQDTDGGRAMLLGSGGSITLDADPDGQVSGTTILFRIDDSERARIDSSGNFAFNSGYGSASTAYGCRAFGILQQSGTHSWYINRGFSASITDLGVGHSQVGFSFTMPDVNYCVQMTHTQYTSNMTVAKCVIIASNQATTGFILETEDVDAGSIDLNGIAISVFR